MGSIFKGKKLFKAKTTMLKKSIGLAQNAPLTPIFKTLCALCASFVWVCNCASVCVCVAAFHTGQERP